MATSYLRDKKRILPCAVRLSGQIAGVRGLYVGAPAMIGKGGVEKIMNIRLKADEREMFMTSVAAVEKDHRGLPRDGTVIEGLTQIQI